MTRAILFALLANASPLVAALWSGFAVMGPWGDVYLTRSGEAYLEGCGL